MLEVVCLAIAVWSECRGCPQTEDKIGVAHVVMNRRNDDTGEFRDYNSTCDVVNQTGHFPWRGTLPKINNDIDKRVWNESFDIAYSVFRGELEDNTNGSMWFHGNHVNYVWTTDLERVSVGSEVHTFWREP